MPTELGRRLLAAGLASPQDVEAALFVSVVRGIPFVRALLDRGIVSERSLEYELGRSGPFAKAPIGASGDLVARLPKQLCARLGAVPTHVDPRSGAVEVAACDPLDPHVGAEIAFHLGLPVRVIGASMSAIEDALRVVAPDEVRSSAARPRRSTPAFPHGAPQSSVPPPPSDDVPIPLVRRSTISDEVTAELETVRTPPAPPSDDEPVLALRRRTKPDPEREAAALNGRPAAAGPWASAIDPEPETIDAATRRKGRPTMPYDALIAPVPALPDIPELPRLDIPAVESGWARSSRPTMPSATASARDRGGSASSPRPVPTDAPSRPAIATGPPPLPSADPHSVLEALRNASNRDQVVLHALHGLRLVARRVAVFAIKRDGFHGWACNPEFGDPKAMRALILAADQPSIFATATATSTYLGPVPRTPGHEALLQVMRAASGNVGVAAARARGRAAMLLVVDEMADTTSGMRWLEKLARAAGEALGRLLPR